MATIASMHMYGFSLQPRLCSTGGRPAKITRTKPLATHDSSAHIPPRFKELQQVLKTKLREASAAGSSASKKLLDAFVDSIFTFSHQSLRPTEVGQASMIAYTLHKMQQQFIALNFL
ncbi:hypothetical protein OsJ_27097 [Oryza sativa Japonica Group]|uniref:Uncharacterized protein n=1 Tax=Oryza sativa subsp. japonica TaxID=39947 RepID=A3BSJ1_ORYSJ|nr:hypothetical protein OsJ_27097 [Oryza sativa Japonica Group]